jgi:PAS domain S-box-containing protein
VYLPEPVKPTAPAGGRHGWSYVQAALLVAAATVLRWLLDPWLGDAQPFLTFFPAALLAAWRLGVGPTVFAVLLSAPLAAWLFFPAQPHVPTAMFMRAVGVVFFCGVSFGAAVLWDRERRARLLGDEKVREALSLREAAERAATEAHEARAHGEEQALRAEEEAARAEEEAARAEEEQLRAEEEAERANAAAGAADAARQRLVDLLDAMRDGFIALDYDWRVTYFNREASVLLQQHPAEVLGRIIWDALPGLRESILRTELEAAMRGHVAAHFDVQYASRGLWLEVDAYPAEEEFAIFFRDITQRRRAAEVSARLAAIVESSDDGILSKQLDGTILSWNAGAERIFGYRADEMVGGSIYRLIPPELRAEEQDILARIARGEHVAHYETTRIRKDGSTVVIELTVSPVRDVNGNIIGASSIKRDITERKRAEEQLRQAAKMEAVGRLAGGIAHEANNQMSVVLGCAAFLLKRGDLAPEARADVEQMRRAAERTAGITAQLLAFGRRQWLHPAPLDLNEMIKGVDALLRRLLGERCQLALELAPDLPKAMADRGQIEQVLLNLVFNARDAMVEGGIITISTDRAEHTHTLVPADGPHPNPAGAFVRFTIADTGHGMDAETRRRVFEPFYSTKEIGRGTGLGLAAVHGIVRQSGGFIRLDSAIGRGTTFDIYLPTAPVPEGAASPAEPRGRRGSGVVLVVEDEPNVLSTIVRVLREDGFTVEGAADGAAALERINALGGSLRLLVTDVLMPNIGGLELAMEARRLHPELPTLLMSGDPRLESEAASRLPAPGEPLFIPKPFTPESLLQAVHDVLDGVASRSEQGDARAVSAS